MDDKTLDTTTNTGTKHIRTLPNPVAKDADGHRWKPFTQRLRTYRISAAVIVKKLPKDIDINATHRFALKYQNPTLSVSYNGSTQNLTSLTNRHMLNLTALGLAIVTGRYDVAEVLIGQGADIRKCGIRGVNGADMGLLEIENLIGETGMVRERQPGKEAFYDFIRSHRPDAVLEMALEDNRADTGPGL